MEYHGKYSEHTGYGYRYTSDSSNNIIYIYISWDRDLTIMMEVYLMGCITNLKIQHGRIVVG